MSRDVAAAAVAESARRGYVDGQALAGVFAWLRPNDLVWNYVVNNYLLGKTPPAFDVLYWNQDAVRLAAGLHRDFVRLALDNSLARPGGLTVLGSPVDLGARRRRQLHRRGPQRPHRAVGERLPQHAAARRRHEVRALDAAATSRRMVNPPAPDSRASYRVADEYPADPQAFLESAAKVPGSWWPDYAAWLDERSGDLRPAPKRLGGRDHRALGKAPGTYVYAR